MSSSHTRKRPVDPNIGMRIELARRRAGLTQAALAQRVGVTGSAISHWETGRHVPRDYIAPLAEALSVSVGWLQGERILGEAERKLEALLLRLTLDGGPELQALLEQFESAEELLAYLRARNPAKKR